MKNDHLLAVRRAIITLAMGEHTEIIIDGVPPADVRAEAEAFARSRKLPCEFATTASGVSVTRVIKAPRGSTYPDLDKLAVGQSHLFELPPAMHQRVRAQAANRSRAGAVRLACLREGDAIRVTRLPIGDAEAKACGPIVARARATIYDLERLSTGQKLTFNVPRAEQSKLRVAVHRQTVKTGWTIRCRLQDDGSMLVYRTDVPAAATAPAQAAE